MTELQTDQCGCESTYGQCQTLLQSSEGCNLHCVVLKIQPHFPQTTGALCLLTSVPPIYVGRRLVRHSVLAKPNANSQDLNLSDCRQHGRPALARQDLAQKPQLLNDGRIFDCFYPARRASNLLCEPKVLKVLPPQLEHGVINYAVECLTSLIARCQDYLLSSVHLYRVFQSKVHSFGSPVGRL